MGNPLHRWRNRVDSWWRRLNSGQSDAAFVEEAYRRVLGRAPDPEGAAEAIQGLRSGTLSRYQILRHIADSPESREYHLILERYGDLLERNDAAFVEEAYRRVLGRTPDPEGAAYAIQGLRSGTLSRYQVLCHIADSPESRDYHLILDRYRDLLEREAASPDSDFVDAAYLAVIGRFVDQPSRAQAVGSLQDGTLTRGKFIHRLVSSSEYQASQIVRSLYRELLNREPRPWEVSNGLELLQAEGMDPAVLRQTVEASVDYYLEHAPPPPNEEPYRAESLPSIIQLEVTARCNMNPPCIMCARFPVGNHAIWPDMAPEVWQSLLPVLRQARNIGLHGQGEPLVYPHLFYLLEYLDPERTHIGFNTNGHLLTPMNCRRLIEHQVAWISISMDAASPEMYHRIRRRDDFDRLLTKIRHLNELKRQSGSQWPWLYLNMTLMRMNLPEAPRFVELAAELEARLVLFMQIRPGAGDWSVECPDGYNFDYRREELSNCLSLHDEVMAQAWQRAREVGVAMDYSFYRGTGTEQPADQVQPAIVCSAVGGEVPPYPPEAWCDDPWTSIIVNTEGDVAFCCDHLLRRAHLGNVRESSFEEIWNGSRARIIRELILGGTSPKPCQGCALVPPSVGVP